MLFGSVKARLKVPAFADVWRTAVRCAMYGAILLVVFGTAPAVTDIDGAIPLAAMALTLVYLPLCTLVHELGHAVAAWIAGWRVHLIAVTGLAYAPRGGWYGRAKNLRPGADVGGWVHATPSEGQAWSPGFALFLVGGILGNLGLALACGFAAATLPQEKLSAFFAGLAAMSLVYVVVNAVPFGRPGAWKSDGAHLIDVLRGKLPSTSEQNLSRLQGMIHDRTPSEQWDPALLNTPEKDQTIDRSIVDPLLLHHAFSAGDLAAAKPILERMLETLPQEELEYRCMYAFAVALLDQDGKHALRVLDALDGRKREKSFSYWRALAVTLHLLGRGEEAKDAVARSRKIARKNGMKPDGDDERVFGAVERGDPLPQLGREVLD